MIVLHAASVEANTHAKTKAQVKDFAIQRPVAWHALSWTSWEVKL